MKVKIKDILEYTNTKLISGNKEQEIQSVSIDTRKMKAGDFYIALNGKNFDGNDFIEEAIQKKAKGILSSNSVEELEKYKKEDFLILQTDDTLQVLGIMAKIWREQFDIPLIGITGSSGKTTTKEFLYQILSQFGLVCSTQGNLNNQIGVPLTLFELKKEHQFGIIEMGMNQKGEIEYLTKIAEPNVALVTNIGKAHLEGLGSLENIAFEKKQIFSKLNKEDWAILNFEDPFLKKVNTNSKRISFGFDSDASIYCSEKEIKKDGTKIKINGLLGEFEMNIPFFGDHFILNILSCLCVGFILGLEKQKIIQAIGKLNLPHLRGECFQINDLDVVDDSYNANPDSVMAAIKSFYLRFPDRRKGLVIGSMGELGEKSQELHRDLGRFISHQDFDYVFALGKEAKTLCESIREENSDLFCEQVDNFQTLQNKINQKMKKKDALLVKGSRVNQLDIFIKELKKQMNQKG